MNFDDVVNIDPETMGGTPVFKGTRVSIQTLFDWLTDDKSLEYFLDNFPGVSKEHAIAMIEIAAKKTIPNESTIRRKLNKVSKTITSATRSKNSSGNGLG